jgi:DNA-binding NtrC family response regulator
MVRRTDEIAVLERDDESSTPEPEQADYESSTPEPVQPQAMQPQTCGNLIGSGPRMRAVYDMLRRISDHDCVAERDITRVAQPPAVLINGESGTGKELVAHAIHTLGNRSGRPFVVVPCGSIPEHAIEAELFGYEKGAFPGANIAREGYFERASNGTLFLDEIGELSLNMQPKLLRALQQREFNRLGSSHIIPVEARILFATHRNLAQMVTAGQFRQDLFYRISVVKVRVPPLRERPEDIAVLAGHFVKRYAKIYRKAIDTIEPAALRLLESHSWPGNVRELENTIQSSIIMSDGTSIRVEHLPEEFQDMDAPDVIENDFPSSFDGMLREYKIKLVNDMIQACNGNHALAAQRLSMSRADLHRLIRVPAAVQELKLA